MKQLIKLTSIMILLPILLIVIASKDIQKNTSTTGQRIAKHVVSFNVIGMDNQRFATGFHLKYEGKVYIVTNKHVCDFNKKVYDHDFIQFEDYVGKVIAVDTTHDLCLVSSNRKMGLKLSENASKPTDELILVGHPRGLGKTIRHGYHVSDEKIYANWIGFAKMYDSIQASFIAYGGNSGSPVCNTDGDVVAVLYAGDPRFHTETVLVPLEYIKKFISKHHKK